MKLENITSLRRDAAKRRYDDACGTAHALDLIGERWALLVMRELMLGPKRFGDLRGDLPGISANVLTQRLEGLEAAGLVERRKLPPPANAQVYALTEWGLEAEPIVKSLGRWAARSPAHDPSLSISATSLMLSFRTMFDRERAGDMRARVGFAIGADSFMMDIAGGRMTNARAPIEDADVVFAGPAPAIGAAIYGGQSFESLAPALAVTGDLELAQCVTKLFPLPEKARG